MHASKQRTLSEGNWTGQLHTTKQVRPPPSKQVLRPTHAGKGKADWLFHHYWVDDKQGSSRVPKGDLFGVHLHKFSNRSFGIFPVAVAHH